MFTALVNDYSMAVLPWVMVLTYLYAMLEMYLFYFLTSSSLMVYYIHQLSLQFPYHSQQLL